MPIEYPKTPELDKINAVKVQSQAIGEFLDIFCRRKGYTLCSHREEGNNGKPRYVWCAGVKKAKLDGQKPTDRKPGRFDYINNDAFRNPEFDDWLEGYYPASASVEKLLAEHFGIDMNKAEDERRAVLDYVRAANAAAAV